MTDTTHGNVIREQNRERSKLIDLLSEARRMLAGCTVHLQSLKDHAPHLVSAQDDLAKIEAFLAAGLFGDKK